MIIIAIINLICSCIIQGIVSNYLGYTYNELSIFFTIYILITALVLKPHFEDEKKYILVLCIFGFVMGITYTDAALLNTCLFLLCYFFTKCFHFFFPYNFFTINISTLFSIFLYHIVTFTFLFLGQYDQYSLQYLIKILLHSIPMTILYTSLNYALLAFITNKGNFKEIK